MVPATGIRNWGGGLSGEGKGWLRRLGSGTSCIGVKGAEGRYRARGSSCSHSLHWGRKQRSPGPQSQPGDLRSSYHQGGKGGSRMGQRCHICHTGEQSIRLRLASRAGPWGAEAGESGPLQQGGHGCVPCGRTWWRPAERSGTGAGRRQGGWNT